MIDYAFVNPDIIKGFEIEDKEKWLSLSDHVPIVLEIKDK